MLVKCPECELPVSDSAETCPHCGFQLKKHTNTRKRSQKTHMRLPNGFGQITEVKDGNRRNRYRAMVTVGKKDNGRPICKILKPQGYFKTYNDAYIALVEYNKNPYELDQMINLGELYDRWSSRYYPTVSESTANICIAAWNYCKNISTMPVRDIRIRHIQECINACDKPTMKPRVKNIMNLMLDCALEYDIVEKNYARMFKYKDTRETQREHEAFSDEEMNIILKNQTTPFMCYVILQCFTGFRPQEICGIRLENVNIIEQTIVGGMKTKAGINRVVPIHDKMVPIVKKISELSKMLGSEYLICDMDGKQLTYKKYATQFSRIMEEVGVTGHRPHDPRKYFITIAKKYNVDEYAIKRIVGHSIGDITEERYTERRSSWLLSEINKIEIG